MKQNSRVGNRIAGKDSTDWFVVVGGGGGGGVVVVVGVVVEGGMVGVVVVELEHFIFTRIVV